MDIIFNCENCEQELAVDASGTGSEIQCPTCGSTVVVPEPTPENTQATASTAPSESNASPTNATTAVTTTESAPAQPPKAEKHFVVPQRSAPEALIKKPKPTLEVAAKEGDKMIRVKTIRHSECVEVGKDRFDEVVTEFLQKIGEKYVISITPVTYTAMDAGGRTAVTEYGVMIVFRG